jgi:superfamily II DNA/RNA helicase
MIKHFNEAGLPEALFHRIEQMGFTAPTAIQAKAIPVALEGKDILGSAQTGTGKTGAYGIPLVAQLLTSTQGSSLVLLPTRELAAQVTQELKKFIGGSKIKTALLIGGESMPKQISQLKQRPRLIIGTPGRINDHLKRGTLILKDTDFLVLDEVDRMLDMGFGVQLDNIIPFIAAKHQTLMFSATLSEKIKKIANKYLTNPTQISVGSNNAPVENIKMTHVKLSESEKYPRLLDELNERKGSILMFVKTKHGADSMAVKLKKLGHKAGALHGDLRQNKRNQVIAAFRNQDFRILIGTDVAARGLDIPHIAHVINYDLPQSPEDYIHRVGRTARAGATGEAINFLSPSDNMKWKEIQRLLNPSATPEDIRRPNSKGDRYKAAKSNRFKRNIQKRWNKPKTSKRAS